MAKYCFLSSVQQLIRAETKNFIVAVAPEETGAPAEPEKREADER